MNWLKEELGRLDRSTKALRRFGLIVGAVSLALGLLLFLSHRAETLPAFITQLFGALLILGAVAAPKTLRPVHAVWMGLSLVIGGAMTRVILTLVFFLVVTPIGLVQRLVGSSSVDLRVRPGASTYWHPREKSFAPADYRNQF